MDSPTQQSNQEGVGEAFVQLKEEVQDVAVIMQSNRDKVLEREGKLNELDDRADRLREEATKFESKTGQVKRKMWWQNIKMKIVIAVCALLLIIIIILVILHLLGYI